MKIRLRDFQSVLYIAILLPLVFCSGCASKHRILANVAKEWCETIRASQIIPVYPLTEDIQPGDVFLVQTTVDTQQQEYKRKGFLPMGNHIVRLDPTGYPDFYDHSFDTKRASLFPAGWQRPANGVASWAPAPHAAFPTYSFSVSNGAGLNMAIPVSGVPIGLSLMGSKSANGSITIENARTLGVDILSAYEDLQAWAAVSRNKTFLKYYGCDRNNDASQNESEKKCPKPNYLRMVTRIYVTGKLTVALSDASSFSGGTDVGVPRPVDLILTKPPQDAQNVNETTINSYTKNLAALNAMLAESFKPSRLSGSNEGLDPPSTDAKIQAKSNAYEEEKKRLQDKLAECQRNLASAKTKLDADKDDPQKADKAQKDKEVAEAMVEFYQSSLNSVSKLLPGGSLRVTSASSNFIGLEQEYDPPLILGYLGFDVEILRDGSLGTPIPTHAILEPIGGETPTSQMAEVLFPTIIPNNIYDELNHYIRNNYENDALTKRAKIALQQLDALGIAYVPAGEPKPFFYEAESNDCVAARPKQSITQDYKGFKAYVDLLSCGPLRTALDRHKDFILVTYYTNNRPDKETVTVDSPRWKALDQSVKQRLEQKQAIEESSETISAVRLAGDVYLRIKLAKKDSKQ